MSHVFAPQDKVRLKDDGPTNGRASDDGVYEVVRRLPQDQSGQFAYRLKSSAGERVATEAEIERA